MQTSNASAAPIEIEFRGAHHPFAAAVRVGLDAVTRPPDADGRPGLHPAIVDATPLSCGDGTQALRAMFTAAEAVSAMAPPEGCVGSCVFLLPPEADGPGAAAAVRRLARDAAPRWRLNAVRIGRVADDAARSAAFLLSCGSTTGQLLALDRPLQASVPAQPDPPRREAARGLGTREVMIRDLVLPCRVGVRRHERDAPQRVRVNLKLIVEETPLHDRLEDVVCYDEIVEHIRGIATGGHVNLVETLAERIADGCFADPRVRSARVAVEKLDVYANATAAGVRIVRNRP